MSRETLNWLNNNVLVGFTEKRGTAWHYKADEQGDESNHYPGAVPVEDIRRRLFGWKPVETRVVHEVIGPDGEVLRRFVDPDKRKGIARLHDDSEDVFNIFKDGYNIHDFDEWLIGNVQAILDDGLSIGSAGLLKRGGVAWVSVEVPENITTPSGVEFRPNLLAATSLDGSLSTTYQRVVTNVVCDNTMSAALGENGQRIKVKHSKNSDMKLLEAREALSIVHSVADDFMAQVERLTNMTVTDAQWEQFVEQFAPVPENEGRGKTMALNKRDDITRLYDHDMRVAPWRGTAYGVVQAVNTFEHHIATARGKTTAERNMLRAVTGKVDEMDAGTLKMLEPLLAA